MSVNSGQPPDSLLSLSECERIDRLCLAFEDQWLGGSRPRIQQFLDSHGSPEATRTLIRELLLLDVTYRQRQGESPELADYAELLPEYQPVVVYVLARSARLEPCVLAPGDRIDRYTVERQLGEGGFGTAYLAYDAKLARHVAIKIAHRLPPPPSLPAASQPAGSASNGGATPASRQEEESRLAASLAHPGIVQVYDVGQLDDGTPYTVLQYVEGCTLRQRFQKGALSFREIADLFCQISDAMAFAHRRGLIHRDLDPNNILLDKDGKPYVADFGLAVHESGQSKVAGEFAGSLPYMAPEQIRGESHRLDGRADIWAIGVMLYVALAGRLPFAGEQPEHVADEILHRDPKPPRQIRPDVPSALEQICLRCLAKSPSDRFPTAGDIAKGLRRWLTRQPQRAGRRALLLSALGAAAALGGWFYATGERSPFQARMDVTVWDGRWMTLDNPGAVPLRTGDQLRLQTRLNRPAHVLLVWVDAHSNCTPLHPSLSAAWDRFPPTSEPIDQLALPGAASELSWNAEFERSGIESILLLARHAPPIDLPAFGIHVHQQLQDLPLVPPINSPTIAWFEGGEYLHYRWQPNGRDRAPPKTALHSTIRDPLLRLHQEIEHRLQNDFDLIQAVSFSVEGSGTRNEKSGR